MPSYIYSSIVGLFNIITTTITTPQQIQGFGNREQLEVMNACIHPGTSWWSGAYLILQGVMISDFIVRGLNSSFEMVATQAIKYDVPLTETRPMISEVHHTCLCWLCGRAPQCK